MAKPPDATLLANVWGQLRELHPQILPATLAVTSAMRSSRCTSVNWAGSPVIELSSATTLRLPVAEVLEYLLHQAAHGIAGPSKGDEGRYHSAVYRQAARGLGLDVTEGATGWSETRLSQRAKSDYGDVPKALSAALTAWRRTTPGPGPRKASRSPVAAWCSCPEPRRVAVMPSVAERGPIRCGICGQPFIIGDKPVATSTA